MSYFVNTDGDTASAVSVSADMDDIILFTKCNPYANIWKLYIDNADLVSLFKINNNLREACIDALPNCFKVAHTADLRKMIITDFQLL